MLLKSKHEQILTNTYFENVWCCKKRVGIYVASRIKEKNDSVSRHHFEDLLHHEFYRAISCKNCKECLHYGPLYRLYCLHQAFTSYDSVRNK